jgi:hypothetical protein
VRRSSFQQPRWQESRAWRSLCDLSRSQTWQLQIPFKWTCLCENHLQMGDVPLPAKGYCTSICICKCIWDDMKAFVCKHRTRLCQYMYPHPLGTM